MLKKLRATNGTSFLSKRLHIPRRLSHFISPSLIRMIRQKRIRMLKRRFTRMPFSSSNLQHSVTSHSVKLMIRASVKSHLFRQVIYAGQGVNLVRVAMGRSRRLNVMRSGRVLMMFTLLIRLISGALRNTRSPSIVRGLSRPIFFKGSHSEHRVLRLPIPIQVRTKRSFQRGLRLRRNHVFKANLRNVLRVKASRRRLILTRTSALILRVRSTVTLLRVISLSPRVLVQPRYLRQTRQRGTGRVHRPLILRVLNSTFRRSPWQLFEQLFRATLRLVSTCGIAGVPMVPGDPWNVLIALQAIKRCPVTYGSANCEMDWRIVPLSPRSLRQSNLLSSATYNGRRGDC